MNGAGPASPTPSRVGEAMEWARARLKAAGCDSPSLDAQILLGHALGWDRARLLAHPEEPLMPAHREAYHRLVARRAAREPLAYIVERRAFWGLDLWVRPGVLIPRPETELLVEVALEWARGRGGADWSGEAVDVGTGSGAVAVALATEWPRARIWATEAAREALPVARENLRRHGVAGRVRLIQADLLAPIGRAADCVVSNPPYIPSAEIENLAPEIACYEPRAAVDGGPDGLAVYRRLIPQATRVLRPGGVLLLEVGHDQADAVGGLLHAHFPGGQVQRFRDLGGHWRVVMVRNQ